MKIQELGPRTDYELTATCINCGHQTRYSELTMQEYMVMQMMQSLCDKCVQKERERIAKRENAE